MAVSFSNFLRAVLFPGNVDADERNISKEKSLAVQHFSYSFARSRNDAGFPYGPTLPTELSFTLRLMGPDDAKLYYSRLKDNTPYTYTFLFNATYNSNMRLENYDDALVVDGFVVDVEDCFNTASAADGSTEQMLLKVKLLVNSFTYKGKENDKVLIINSR